MSVEKKEPEIRFEGFSGEWEEKTLGDHTEFRRGSFPQPYGNREWYGGVSSMPFVQVVDVSKHLSLVEDTKQKISLKAQSFSVFAPKGSVVVTLQGTIGRVAITQYDSFFDRTILIFKSFSKNTDPSFWAYTIQNKFDLEKKRAPGGTIKTITKDALSSFEVLIPSIEEQTKIGNYFQKLDSLINQHQKKHDKLSSIKKSMLEKMFPKQGETIPEIRFKGFSGEWEERSFGACFANVPNNTLSRAELNYQSGLAKNIHYGDVLIKFDEILDADSELIPFITNNDVSNKLKHTALRNGDIVIADAAEDNTVGKCLELFNVGELLVISGLHTIAVRPTFPFASKYLGYYLNSASYHDQLLSLMQGTKVLSISKTAIQNTYVVFPNNAEEQTAIGNYFQKLDSLINQHQQQITKLKNIKQACLSKMFV